MHKIIKLMALAVFTVSLHGAGTMPVKFLNKTDTEIGIAGNSNPSNPNDFLGKAWQVPSGKEVTVAVVADNPRIVFWEASKPEAAFVYGFKNQSGKKSIDVRIVLSKGAYKVEPQTTLGVKRFDEKDIVPLQGICANTQFHRCSQAAMPVQPTAGDKQYLIYLALNLQPSATDADILGLSAADAKIADKIKAAWRKKSFAWHPDKLAQEPARSRFKESDLAGLTDQDKKDLMTEVIKRINDARDRLMKTAK